MIANYIRYDAGKFRNNYQFYIYSPFLSHQSRFTDTTMNHATMNHATMNHATMNHAAHTADMSHNMPDMADRCSMNMLFTWDWKNVCIVYRWWHVRTTFDFIVSFIAVVGLGIGYEFIKYWVNKWEKSNVAVISGSTINTNSATLKSFKLKQSLFYGFQVGYSFMLMLVFMTYNGWFMIAVVLGAIIGKQIWGNGLEPEERSMACH